MDTVHCTRWLATKSEGFDIYTDHINLVFTFDPLSVVKDLSKNSVRKCLLWGLGFSLYNYTCIQIKSTEIFWADGMFLTKYFVWFTFLHSRLCPPRTLIGRHSMKSVNPAAEKWISDLIQMLLCAIAHNGTAENLGRDSTECTTRQSYFCSTMTSDVHSFVRVCIHSWDRESASNFQAVFVWHKVQ